MYESAYVAERIKELAKQQNVTVKKMLEDVGLGFNTMSNMKTSMPKADNLAKIADYFGVTVDYLLGRTDELPTEENDHILFWNRFYDLCVKHGTKPNPVGKEIGISSGILSKWKTTDTVPNGETLLKIADYFGVTTDYLLGRADTPAGNEKTPTPKGERLVSDDDIKFALFGSAEISDADLEDVRRYAAFIKARKGQDGDA